LRAITCALDASIRNSACRKNASGTAGGAVGEKTRFGMGVAGRGFNSTYQYLPVAWIALLGEGVGPIPQPTDA